MHAEYSTISKAVRHLQQLRPTKDEFNLFRRNLGQLISKTEEVRKTSSSGALEETEKGLLKDFLRDTFYKHLSVGNLNYRGNTGADLTIRSAKNNTLVLFECKAGNNPEEMPTPEKLLGKAFLEAVAYYCFEKDVLHNDHMKHVVVTNVREWYVFDAADFRAATHGKAKIRDAFKSWNKGNWDNSSTAALHKRIAELLSEGDDVLHGVHVDLWSFKKYLDRDDEQALTELLKLYRFLSPGFLLKEGTGKDNNTLNKGFYNELLHILGLHESKEKGVKRIKRLPEDKRHQGMLIENTIVRLKNDGCLDRLEHKEQYGDTEDEQLFAVAMELCITWLDRILFLKLLEAQLLRYHDGDRLQAFLAPTDEGQQYDYLNTLFFDVMARENSEREPEVRKQFGHVPYLNSTLFEPSELEGRTMRINGLRDGLRIPLHPKSILIQRKLYTQDLQALDYLLRFLDTYDFGSKPGEVFTDDDRPLITASVLGLIFEKLNGYKDGSFYTPGFITMYMCGETLRPTVVQRYNERFGLALSGFEALRNHCAKLNEHEEIAAAEAVVDSIRVCDPAVGSGHFLVSALNELLCIKSDLGLLTDVEGNPLHGWTVSLANDEITVTDRTTDAPFKYLVPPDGKPIPAEMQRVQRALFEQKRKLIEGCLFGVDINPNSVKICRLRLWIELLKNAYYTSPPLPGRGAGGEGDLRTLPNIDINIKRGNSLYSRFALSENIERIMQRTSYTAEQYRGFVQDYKGASNREERAGIKTILQGIEAQFLAYSQSRDPRVVRRSTLVNELEKLTGGLFGGGQGYSTAAAKAKAKKRIGLLEKHINAVSEELTREMGGRAYGGAFEWRYAFPEVLDDNGNFRGFDVVIGNPPYIDIKEMAATDARMLFKHYTTAQKRINLYALFIERGLELLEPTGRLAFIVPNSLLVNESYSNLRKKLVKDLHRLVKLPDGIFEEAAVETMLLFVQKGAAGSIQAKVFANDEEPVFTDIAFRSFDRRVWEKDPEHRFAIYATAASSAVCMKIEAESIPLGTLCDFTLGITPYDKARDQSKELIRNRGFHSSTQLTEEYVPLIDGGSITRYRIETTPKEWLKYGPWLGAPRERRFFTSPRLIARQIVSGAPARIYVGYTEAEVYHTQIGFAIIPKPGVDLGLKYLLGVLNSTLMNYYHQERFLDKEKVTFQKFLIANCKRLPIRIPTNEAKVHLEALVEQRLELVDDSPEVATVEAAIDAVVYGVYGLTDAEVGVVLG
ncbi:MAG: N-6 DNA methylase [Flavobacteriales bacterium]|nr:N-6 DNA methylase [Flavobacteriales bacterium]